MTERFTLHHGDCIKVMRTMPDNSVDSIVTDPPYELGFMGKSWDASGIAFNTEVWTQALRVLKPGGHLLAFSGSRTYHRMAVAIEDAGFEIRDQIMWIYGSGFPKSLDVSKAIDKAAGAEREVVGTRTLGGTAASNSPAIGNLDGTSGIGAKKDVNITAPATPAAQQWAGWGTALKPAHEPIVVARKPLTGTVAANVLAHGVGALNIDGCRVPHGDDVDLSAVQRSQTEPGGHTVTLNVPGHEQLTYNTQGRWPANVIHDGSDEVVALFPQSNGGAFPKKSNIPTGVHYEGGWGAVDNGERTEMGSGSAARFFYCAKANKKDRNEGLDGFEAKPLGDSKNASLVSNRKCKTCGHHKFEANPCKCAEPQWEVTASGGKNHHPTVKPTDLMRYLIRLVTPQGATILDPFMGSGSTGKAAMYEGVNFIGIEQDAEYLSIAKARIKYALNKPLEDQLFERTTPTTDELIQDQLPLPLKKEETA